jgi:hypothetical protein
MSSSIEKSLCRINVGKIDHMLCYDCMAKLVLDFARFADMNLDAELNKLGVKIEVKAVI